MRRLTLRDRSDRSSQRSSPPDSSEGASGAAAVVTLAAGAGSRWTQGAGVVKALHPFAKLGGRHRSFLEVHLAKNRRVARLAVAETGGGYRRQHDAVEPVAKPADDI